MNPILLGAIFVVGAVGVVFLLAFLLKKYKFDPEIVSLIIETINSLEVIIVDIFGTDAQKIVNAIEKALEAIKDNNLSETEGYDLAINIIDQACSVSGITMTPPQKIIVSFLVKKLVTLVVKYNKEEVAFSALGRISSASLRFKSGK